MSISNLALEVSNLSYVLFNEFVCDEGLSLGNKFISNKLHTRRIETLLHVPAIVLSHL